MSNERPGLVFVPLVDTFGLCLGHPELPKEPKPKHDGMLDEKLRVQYYRADEESLPLVGTTDGTAVSFYTPKQALSLLAWLYQEQETLEALAKEQA